MARKTADHQLPNRLRDWRELRGLTLEALGQAAGLSKQHLGKLETGKRKLTNEWMKRIAPHLGVEAADLLRTDAGGLTDRERFLIETYRDLPEPLRVAFDALCDAYQPFRGDLATVSNQMN